MTAVHSVPLLIGPEHPALPGHFPGNRLVPGVVLLERVATAWKTWRGLPVGSLDAKFVQALRPGENAMIKLYDEGKRVRFEVTRADGRMLARGTLGAAKIQD
jgi:3-hydroxyacyl-[acyl-carrier-protein] dehydratase